MPDLAKDHDLLSPGRRASQTILGASLIAFSGGALDAFLYLNHGRVFAGAMTGNAVLCGIALLGGNGRDALHHAVPLLTFFVGVWLAELIPDHVPHHAVAVGLLAEILGLLVASFLPPEFPNLLFVPFVVLLAAYQIATFRKVDEFSYNSTFITGNLRALIAGLHQALRPAERSEGLREARDLGCVVACFLAGATLGALLARRLGNHTLLLPVLTLSIVLFLVLRRLLFLQERGLPAGSRTGSG